MAKPTPHPVLDHPFEAQNYGIQREVAPNLFWVRSPMPFALDHINLWLAEEDSGWSLVDTGFPTDDSKALWQSIFDTSLKEKNLTQLYITHFHPDHIGFSDWLCRRWTLTPTMTQNEWETARALCSEGSDELTACYEKFYRLAGCDNNFIAYMKGRKGIYKSRVTDIPKQFQCIRDGDTVSIAGQDWRVIVGHGHSPEHACFYNAADQVFIAGDLVLPRITPNISVWAHQPDSNPLKDYMNSLQRFKTLVLNNVLVLPSHGLPFYGLHQRCDQITRHHQERLDKTLEICAIPKTALQVTHALIRLNLDHHNMFFAIGEAIAHLNYLIETGTLTRYVDEGVNRYKAE